MLKDLGARPRSLTMDKPQKHAWRRALGGKRPPCARRCASLEALHTLPAVVLRALLRETEKKWK